MPDIQSAFSKCLLLLLSLLLKYMIPSALALGFPPRENAKRCDEESMVLSSAAELSIGRPTEKHF